jgi:hypothetical protein
VPHYMLEPEVAGGLGPHTVMTTNVHPPQVEHLHYEVEGWLGDELLESTPCFLISPEAAAALEQAGCTGLRTADAEVTITPDAAPAVDSRVTGFLWLQPQGQPGRDDVAVDATASLVVSERALEVLRGFRLEHCDVTDVD